MNPIDINFNIASFVENNFSSTYEAMPWLKNTILTIPIANIILAFFFLFFFLFLRRVFTHIVIVFLQKKAKETSSLYDDNLILALKSPFRFLFFVIGVHLFFLFTIETNFIKNILNSLLVYSLFWAILSVIEALRGLFYETTAKINENLAKEIGDFIMRIVKFLIMALGVGTILEVWGINVTALLASLGLGGLAFALAAKDTASNLFGSLALLADKSIAVGEWIKVNGVEGVVETIGMRTTKIRSFEKSLITIPNQIVANKPIENFSRRGIRRIKLRVGLTYTTKKEQMQNIVKEVTEYLKSNKNISQTDTMLVKFEAFNDSSLTLFIYTFTNTSNWANYLEIREELHFEIMKIVEKNGSSFAFPSQSLYIESLKEEKKD